MWGFHMRYMGLWMAIKRSLVFWKMCRGKLLFLLSVNELLLLVRIMVFIDFNNGLVQYFRPFGADFGAIDLGRFSGTMREIVK